MRRIGFEHRLNQVIGQVGLYKRGDRCPIGNGTKPYSIVIHDMEFPSVIWISGE